MAEREQERRLTQDPWYEILLQEIGDIEHGKISGEAIWTILDTKPAQRGQEGSRRIGEAMRKLRWRRANASGIIKIEGKTVTGYVIGKRPFPKVTAYRNSDGSLQVDVQEAPERERVDTPPSFFSE
jgi:hypothetical protein